MVEAEPAVEVEPEPVDLAPEPVEVEAELDVVEVEAEPAVEVEPEPVDLAPEPVEVEAELDVVEVEAEPAVEVEPEPVDLEPDLAEAEGLEMPEVAIATPRRVSSRLRRILMAAGGLVVLAAVVASLMVFVRAGDGGNGGPLSAPPAETLDTGEPPAGAGQPGAVEAGVATEAPLTGVGAEPVSLERLELLGEDLLASISRYYGLAVALDEGRIECAELQRAYVEVEDRWIDYSVQGRARWPGRLPDDLDARDARLYQGVRDVEQEFGRSGCPRP